MPSVTLCNICHSQFRDATVTIRPWKIDPMLQQLLESQRAASLKQIEIVEVETKIMENKIMALVSHIKSAACLPCKDPNEKYLLDLLDDATKRRASAVNRLILALPLSLCPRSTSKRGFFG